MPLIVPELNDLTTSSECKDRGGWRIGFWAEYSHINWAAMVGDPLLFDPVNEQILGYAMQTGEVFHKIEPERKSAFYDFTFTSDTDVYTSLITMMFKGKDLDRRNRLARAIGVCNIVFHLYDNNNQAQRVVGVDYNGESFSPILEFQRVSRHLDSSGQLGSSRARDEMDLGGESFFPPLFANVPEANIPLV